MNYQDTSMRAQMSVALKRNAPVVIFCGARDVKSESVAVKNTRTRKQESVPRSEMVNQVRAFLAQNESLD